MKASRDNIKHLPEGTMLLLRFTPPVSHPREGDLRLARITGEYKDLTTLPVESFDYSLIHDDSEVNKITDPTKWTTQLIGDSHEILFTYLPESAVSHRKPTSADVGLVVVGTELRDTVVQRTVRFRLYEVGNGYARVEGGGSFKIDDHDWLIDPNSRKRTPVEDVRQQYIDVLEVIAAGNGKMENPTEFVDAFIERLAEAQREERRQAEAAAYSDGDTDPADLDDA